MCIPLACIVIFGYQQYAVWQSGTATAVEQSTRQAILATQTARSAFEAQQTSEAAALTAQAQLDLAGAEATGTAEALLVSQSLTEAANVPPTDTEAPTETEILPTETATKPAVAATARPRTFTVTIRECRGFEGTVLFSAAPDQSLHAYQSISFTVPAGTYKLRILWLNHRDQDVDLDLKVDASQTIQFGDSCQ
jgi:hypothetical protein